MKKIIIIMLIFSVILQTISLTFVIYYQNLPVQNSLTARASNEGAISITIISNEATPEPGPASSGGGGGGGGGRTGASGESNFSVSPTDINVFTEAGKSMEREITVTNNELKTIDFAASISGIVEFASLSEKTFSLGAGESKKIILKLKAGDAGVYAGRASFSSGATRKDVFIILNVQSGDALFDSSLTIPENYKRIPLGATLKAFISLVQVGPADSTDVTVNYMIKDFYGNSYNKETETFNVNQNKNYVKEFSTRGLSEGEYVAAIEVVYSGGFASASGHFTIYKRSLNFYIILLLVLLIMSIIVLIYSIKKYREAKTLKYGKRGGKNGN